MPLPRRENAKEIRKLIETVLALQVAEPQKYGTVFQTADLKQMTYGELLVFQLVERGCTGDMSAIREVLDRLYGKPVQTNENINANLSYYDFLMGIVEAEGLDKKPPKDFPVQKRKTISVQPTPLPPESEDLFSELP